MAITVYGRRAIRRVERELGFRVVHMVGYRLPVVTTIDHEHYQRTDRGYWIRLDWRGYTDCGMALTSCGLLFGRARDGVPANFMRGRCSRCHAGASTLHRWNCPTLIELLDWPSINPDYWPTPTHRPLWMDDPRRYR